MKFIEGIYEKLRASQQRILFTEGHDLRIIIAAAEFTTRQLGAALLLGKPTQVKELAEQSGISIDGIEIVDPAEFKEIAQFSDQLSTLARYRGISPSEARKIVTQSNYFGAMMLRNNYVDGLIGGATSVSGSILRPLFQLIKPAAGVKFISSCMVMDVPDSTHGDNGLFIFADCGVIPKPTAEQLASIAVEAAVLSLKFLNSVPRVAMLSYSTKGSALTEDTEKIVEATSLAKQQCLERNLEVEIDGELQVDTALVKEVAELKAPESRVAGRANVLIFPDLNSGNIALKLVQRLAHADAYGQILMGLAKPAADLSRGAGVHEIVGVAALIGFQSMMFNKFS